jgi:DNA (cytosine-5)-methyltransferase 1
MEAVRVIKEMRSSTNGLYPTFAVWENVPGAFSSNGGEDFRAVLEELARVEQPDTSIPKPPKGGRWSKAGAIAGNGWSLAWRQLDAQYWGVPQRRKRIALVADFGGQRAAEILFERTSLSGNPDESVPTWKEIARLAANCPAGNDSVVGGTIPINTQIATRYISMGERTGIGIGEDGDPAYTLQANHEHGVCYCIAGNIIDRSETAGANGSGVKENQSYTLNTVDRPAVAYKVFDARGNGDGRTCPTITGDHENRITDYTAIAVERKTFNEQSFSHYKESDKSSTLKAKAGNIGNGSESLVVEKTSIAVDGYNGAVTGEKAASLTCKNDGSHSGPLVAEKTICWIVRRLTPVECERLQGYPDDYTNIGDWTDSKGKKHKYADSPRYKALGNSIALPQWFWLVQRMCPYLKEKPTLGSLFDGIGGFPLVWQRAYGEGTARWASEIEEFPMAVTKRRFGEQ